MASNNMKVALTTLEGQPMGFNRMENLLIHYYTDALIYGKRVDPILLLGPPGCGKSQMMRKVHKTVLATWKTIMHGEIPEGCYQGPDPRFYEISLASSDVTTFTGMPYVFRDPHMPENCSAYEAPRWIRTIYAPPTCMPGPNEAGMMLLDELTTALPLEQRAGLKILSERVNGAYELLDNVFMVGAGNRAQDKSVFASLIGPMKTRFNRFTLIPDWDDYREFFIRNFHPEIAAYIEFDKSALYHEDVEDAINPRAWEHCSKQIDTGLLTFDEAATSSLNGGIAATFSAFAQKYGAAGMSIVDYVEHLKFFDDKSGELIAGAYVLAQALKSKQVEPAQAVKWFAAQAKHYNSNEYGVVYLHVLKAAGCLEMLMSPKSKAYEVLSTEAVDWLRIVL